MRFRKANLADAGAVMEILAQGQEYFRRSGIDQWQNGYPNADVVNADIERGVCFVAEDDSGVVVAVSAIFGDEPTYANIFDGAWLSGGPYVTVHRIAVRESRKGAGIAGYIMNEVVRMALDAGVKSMRVDTHEDNASMRRMLEKNGCVYCGVIYLDDGAKRVAYERVLE